MDTDAKNGPHSSSNGQSRSGRKVRPWHIANTTVRTPFRLKGGLKVLVEAGFEGNLHKEQEEAIALALDEAGVIALSSTTTDVTSISRKWRSVLEKLGFIRPKVEPSSGVSQTDVGQEYTLTPNGRRLLACRSLEAEQEVLLRSLAALQLPSPIEAGYDFPPFSPLRHVIRVIFALESLGADPSISRMEMAGIVQFTHGSDQVVTVAEDIIEFRERREEVQSRRKFDGDWIRERASMFGQKHQTLLDYQDVSFRYLKSTGLFRSRGRGIALAPEKLRVARLLADEADPQLPAESYIERLGMGSGLPTDSLEGAGEVLSDLVAVASEWKVNVDLSGYDLDTPQGNALARHDLEAVIQEAREIEYGARQVEEIDEILTYMQLLENPSRRSIQFKGESLSIRKEERPAYFEWTLWRILLALGQLRVPPYAVRRFEVDGDFLPVGTASGGGADVVGVYDDAVLVVEVTLTENSRQEAAEGEPVRRHVADLLETYEPLGKQVYGLFVARRIDTNTAETFRIGVWYLAGDRRVDLDIVPVTLSQLRGILEYGIQQGKLDPSIIFNVIQDLAQLRRASGGAPEWKSQISGYIQGLVNSDHADIVWPHHHIPVEEGSTAFQRKNGV